MSGAIANEPTIALVFSPETWVERLHRRLADHGGARVRQIVLEPALALEDGYDTLVVSDRWPGLTRPFVSAVRERGHTVLGVFDADEPAGRAHLLGLGADATVSSDAPVDEFVRVLAALSSSVPADATPGLRPDDTVPGDRGGTEPIVVTGPPGSGTSEVALGLAAAIASHDAAILVDADEAAPSVATRLGLPLEPNLRCAVDAVVYGVGDVRSARLAVAPRLEVVPGFPGTAAASQVRPSDVVDVVRVLASAGCAVVVEVSGARDGEIARAVTELAGTAVVVGSATPVGIARVLAFLAARKPLLARMPVHVVFNRTPAERFRRAEVDREMRLAFAPAGIWFLPGDRRVDAASWDGVLVARGPFTGALTDLAAAVSPPPGVRTRRAHRSTRAGRAA